MRRTSRMARTVAVAVLALAGCANASEEQPLADPPLSPTATTDAAGESASTTSPFGASAPGSGEVQTNPSLTRTERPPGILATPSPRERVSSAAHGAGSADGPSPDVREPGAVGPAASYEDAAGDAHGGASVESLSQSPLDILDVDWTPVSYDEQGRRGYSTSITIAGPARDDAAYVSYGFFSDGSGDRCQLYNILELGTSAYANAFCGSIEDGTRRFIGRIDGRPVTSTPTAAGGTTLVGTFDDPAVHSMLEAAGRWLDNLSAFTATCAPSPDECKVLSQEWDWVSSTESFRV